MSETFAQRLTGDGMGAIAVVELRGGCALEIVEKIFQNKRVSVITSGQVLRGNIVDAHGEHVDDGLLVCAGDERFELHVHGGVAVVEAVMRVLAEAGATIMSAPRAAKGIVKEVEAAIASARTMAAARLVAAQSDVGLMAWARHWQAWEGELWVLQSAGQWLLERSRSLRWLMERPRVAIVGPPNAGKSTLANALLGRTVAITSDIAGTTRDWVDAEVVLTAADESMEIAATLVDTAGVRETSDPLEGESIVRTFAQARAADLGIVVLDGSREFGAGERGLIEMFAGRPCVVVVNKMDLERVGNFPDGAVRTCALRGEGVAELMQAVLERLEVAAVGEGEAFAFTARQKIILEQIATTPDASQVSAMLDELMNG